MRGFLTALLALAWAPTACRNDQEQAAEPPQLMASSPALGEADVYPAPMWRGKGEEAVIELVFSEPMTLAGELALGSSDEVRPVAELVWSEDRTELSLYARANFSWPRPLADGTEYWLETSPLVGESGTPLHSNVGLRDRRLEFITGRFDALLNHSCGHTFFGPFQAVGASAAADASAPDIGTTHVQYTVALREAAGGYGGWLRAEFAVAGKYRLYFDAETELLLGPSAENALPLDVAASARACPGISHEVTFEMGSGEEAFLFLGPTDTRERRVIVELVPEAER